MPANSEKKGRTQGVYDTLKQRNKRAVCAPLPPGEAHADGLCRSCRLGLFLEVIDADTGARPAIADYTGVQVAIMVT